MGPALWTARGTSCELEVDYSAFVHSVRGRATPDSRYGTRSPSTTVVVVRLILPTKSGTETPPTPADTLRADGATPCGDGVEISDDLVRMVALEDRPAPPDRPWVVANMVCSADGAATGVEGRSASLSGPADRALFLALRSIADVILAGASTVRAENYGAPLVVAGADAVRSARDQAPIPRLAVPTASLRLDPDARLFREARPGNRPIVLTSTHAAATAPERLAALTEVADVRPVGEAGVDWAAATRLLREEYAARMLLVEGGPTINAQLVDLDLVDELCLTVSPLLLGGAAQRILADVPAMEPRALRLDRVLEDEGFLLLRYLRRR
jgi:riboflavin biosynthesis pyrimidine reductase